MPNIGDIAKGRTIGKKPLGADFIYLPCPGECGEVRYINTSYSGGTTPPKLRLCKRCSIKKGGKEFKVGNAT